MNIPLHAVEGIALGSFILFLSISFMIALIGYHPLRNRAVFMMISGAFLFMVMLIFEIDIPWLIIISHNLMQIGFIIGLSGRFLTRYEMLINVLITYGIVQIIGYSFSLEPLQSVVVNAETTTYNVFGPSQLIPMIVATLTYLYYKKIKNINIFE